MNRRYCLALDLKNDLEAIKQYEWHHSPEGVWPEVLDSIKESGIELMQIYRTGNRLFMILEVTENFSFDEKERLDAANLKIQEWEELMWKFQKPLPWAQEGQKWVLMERIFEVCGNDFGI
ncbi:MAG: L-rhamnose mutarotase [Phaeodactylibacter sp.]|nr:L-rhamnose mutarotase [Phaeodactylibacter sp.]MCB9291670.1 L-rhamnose mutarotase [Lewinellaceae bacterium]